jgi:tetratricopeptide (TPR) repeat protein
MPQQDQSPEPQTPAAQPDVLVPISAAEFETKQMRVRWSVLLGAAAVVGIAVYTYLALTAPGRALETYDSALQLFNNARYEEAIVSLDRALNYKPDYPEAFMLRGLARFQNSIWKDAVGDFTKVVELQPGNAQGFLRRAMTYVELKDFKKAVPDCDRVIALEPRLAAGYRIKGIVMRELGEPEKGLVELGRAVELEPNLQNYLERGNTYQKVGEHQKAIEDFDEAHRLDPINPQPLYARSRSKRELGDEAGAKQDHEAARKIEGFY